MSFGCERSCSSPRRVSNFNSKEPQFFIYGPQYIFFGIFRYSGGGGGPWWPINNRTRPILLNDLLSYRVNVTYD